MGGGVYCEESFDMTVTDCTIDDNEATSGEGGGIHCYYSGNLDITNGSVSGNNSGSDGGGVYFDDDGVGYDLTITDCQIDGNTVTSGDGGGVYCYADSMDVSGGSVGTADNGNTADGSGGGIYCDADSSLTVDSSCQITSNEATNGDGGGIYCDVGDDLDVDDSDIDGNYASGFGGGIYFTSGTNLYLDNCSVSYNDADNHGGGVYCAVSGDLTVTGGQVSGNTSGGQGGGIYCNDTTNLTIGAAQLVGNASSSDGGGIYSIDTVVTITTSTISSNGTTTAGSGGGLYCENASLATVRYSVFIGNTAIGNGGGMLFRYTPAPDPAPYGVRVANSIIAKNTAADPVGEGGGIFFRGDLDVLLTNNTLHGNVAYVGGGLAFNRLTTYTGSYAEVWNCILFGNDALRVDPNPLVESEGDEVYNRGDFPIHLWYCCIASDVVEPDRLGGFQPHDRAEIYLEMGTLGIADPNFVDAANNDYHLDNTPSLSPCIDAGDNAAAISAGLTAFGDLDGNTRIIDGDGDTEGSPPVLDTVDTGAYEYQPPP
jgi:predicted outer membrane repeat protein